MKQLVDRDGNRIASLDDQNRIVDGYHRVFAFHKLGNELFIKEGDTLVPVTFEDEKVTLH